MRWCVIRHPELGLAVVAEPSLVVHKPLGWQRVSEFTTDRESLRVDEYADAPAVDDEPEPEPADTTTSADGEQPADNTTSSDAGKPAAKPRKAVTAGEREN